MSFLFFIGLIIVSTTLGSVYDDAVGWLVFGGVIMLVTGMRGLIDYLHGGPDNEG